MRELMAGWQGVLANNDIPLDGEDRCRFRVPVVLSTPVAPHVPRCKSIEATETTIEIRQVAEAGIIGNGADRAMNGIGLAQQTVSPRKTLPDQKLREGGTIGFKHPLHVPWRHAEVRGDAADRQIAPVAALDYIGLRHF